MKFRNGIFVLVVAAAASHPVTAAEPSRECLAAIQQDESLLNQIEALTRPAAEVLDKLDFTYRMLEIYTQAIPLCTPVLGDLIAPERPRSIPEELVLPELRERRRQRCPTFVEDFDRHRRELPALQEEYRNLERQLAEVFERWERWQSTLAQACQSSGTSSDHESTARSCGGSTAQIVGSWKWFGGTTTTVTFSKDGTAAAVRNRDNKRINWANWRCEGSTLVVEWQKPGFKFVDRLELTEGGKKLEGTNNTGQGVWGGRK